MPFSRAAALLGLAGGAAVSATTVMNSVRSAGAAIAAIECRGASDLFRDGVALEAGLAAEEVLVEAGGTWMRMRGGSMSEVKAMVAYAARRAAPASSP